MRAAEVDNQLDESLTYEAPRLHSDSISEAIETLYDQLTGDIEVLSLDCDEERFPHALDEFKEVLKAWNEAVADLEEIRNDRKRSTEQFKEEHRTRLRHYPTHVSVDGAVAVSVGIPMALQLDLKVSGQTIDVLRGLAFFYPSDSQISDDNVQLQLPLLLIKNPPRYADKRSNRHSRIATRNEQRIATASAAWFLARLGIKDFPVFGLVTSTYGGKRGYLSQAWFSEKDNVRSLRTLHIAC